MEEEKKTKEETKNTTEEKITDWQSMPVAEKSNFLHLYYSHLFPWGPFRTWAELISDRVEDREFALRVLCDNENQDDSSSMFVRVNRKDHGVKERKSMNKLNNFIVNNAGKIMGFHIGCVRPSDLEIDSLKIDLDFGEAWDQRRGCECKGSAFCSECWEVMTSGVSLINEIIESDFGYNETMCSFSGRRGFHIRVDYPRFTGCGALSYEELPGLPTKISVLSRQIVTYLSLPKHTQAYIHPLFETAEEKLEPVFARLFAKYIHPRDGKLRKVFMEKTSKLGPLVEKILDAQRDCTPAELWAECKKEIIGIGAVHSPNEFDWKLREAMLWFVFPIIDTQASGVVDHLIRAPFSVHWETGLVCLPVKHEKIANFSFEKDTVSVLDLVGTDPGRQKMSHDKLTESVKVISRHAKRIDVSSKKLRYEDNEKKNAIDF